MPSPAGIPRSGIFTDVFPEAFHDREAAISAYAQFCAGAVYAGSQHPTWISSWLGEVSDDKCLIAIVWKDGKPALALALEIRQFGPLSIASFTGGTHANNNFPAISGQALDYEDLLAALLDIRAARPDIDALFLERQRMELDGQPNPLLKLRHIISPNISLAIDLDTCRHTKILGSPGKMKRHRNAQRKLEAAGDVRIFRASTHEEVDTLFDHFLAWKEARFARQGVSNVFGPADVRQCFRKVFHSSLSEDEPSFILYGLEVGGKLRAVNGYGRSREGLLCDFLAYCNDELATISPGEYLTYEIIAEASERGDAAYNFGVGDEVYKRSWYAQEHDQIDMFLGLTFRGRIFCFINIIFVSIKRFIKRNRFANMLLRRVRRLGSSFI